MDYVILQELEVDGHVGILDWERQQSQLLLVTCKLGICAKAVSLEDDIAKTIDYAQVRECIHCFAADNRVDLLETWAEQLAASLFDALPAAQELHVQVFKPNIFKDAKGAGVSIERHRVSG